jgi:hypothetical protein
MKKNNIYGWKLPPKDKKPPIIFEMKLPNLIADKPNTNGRIYPRRILEQMAETINTKEIHFCTEEPAEGGIRLDSIIGKVSNARVEGDGLVVKIEQLQNMPLSDLMEIFLPYIKEGKAPPIFTESIGSYEENSNVLKEANIVCLYPGPVDDPSLKEENNK